MSIGLVLDIIMEGRHDVSVSRSLLFLELFSYINTLGVKILEKVLGRSATKEELDEIYSSFVTSISKDRVSKRHVIHD